MDDKQTEEAGAQVVKVGEDTEVGACPWCGAALISRLRYSCLEGRYIWRVVCEKNEGETPECRYLRLP